MIVRQRPESVQLITQPDHASVAGLIMSRSTALDAHPRRSSILLAVAEHDNGWREEDADPAVDTDTGEVVDFVRATLAVRHRVWPRGVARLAHDRWAAALVAQHAITVYDRFRPDPAWDLFFAEMTVARDRLLQAAARPLDLLLEDYVHVRLGDLISLAFCTGWTDDHRFAEWTVRLTGAHVLVTPDLFGGEICPIRVEARQLDRRTFASHAALREALRVAAAVHLEGTVGAA
jgi:hypothetical protein